MNLTCKDDRDRNANPQPANPPTYSTPDWTEDSTQVDREYTEVCEKRDYYHLLHHSSDCFSLIQP
jgi:hypothetical protein